MGVTSASAIWLVAAIGAVIGVGFPWLGVKLAILAVAILVGVDFVETRFDLLQRGVHARIAKRWGRNEHARSHPSEEAK